MCKYVAFMKEQVKQNIKQLLRFLGRMQSVETLLFHKAEEASDLKIFIMSENVFTIYHRPA